MKKIIIFLMTIIQMSCINAFAENTETNIPSVAQFQANDYVVYQNSDTGAKELAVIYGENNVNLIAESNNQLGDTGIPYLYKNNPSVPDFDRPKLTINADNDVWAVKYIAENNSWIETELLSGTVICDNLQSVIDSNMTIIEKLHTPVEMWLNDNYTGKDFAIYYAETSQEQTNRYIAFSDDAFNYDKRVLLPSEDHRCAFENIVYGNGVYIAVGCPQHTKYETAEINSLNYNYIMYVISDDMEILRKEDVFCYRECKGFYNGYFYFEDEYGKEENYKKEYKKSADGINYTDITETEFNDISERISLEKKYNDNGYRLSDMSGTDILVKDNTEYTIEYESDDMRLCSGGQRKGDGWICSIYREETQKRFLSFDGVYPCVMLPVYDNSGFYSFRAGDYIYAQKDRDYYYRIYAPKTENIYVVLNNKILGFSTPPIIENGRTLVPMRFLFEQMGADVEWDQETQTATATMNNTAVAFSINDTSAEVNGTAATMDVPARLINDKTMVPLRFLSEEMGYTVTWDEATRTAVIE